MEINDIIALAKAGFSSEEISKMAQMPEENVSNKEEINKTAKETKTSNKTAKETETSNKTESESKHFDSSEIISAIKDLKNVIISNNNHKNIGKTSTETTEDILASILNPKETKKHGS